MVRGCLGDAHEQHVLDVLLLNAELRLGAILAVVDILWVLLWAAKIVRALEAIALHAGHGFFLLQAPHVIQQVLHTLSDGLFK